MDPMVLATALRRRTALMGHRLRDRAMVRPPGAKADRRIPAGRNPVYGPAITVHRQVATPWQARRPDRTARIGASGIRANAQSSSR